MIYWIWLASALGSGSSKFLPLIKKYRSAEAIYHLKLNDILTNPFLSKSEAKKLSDKRLNNAQKIIETCRSSGIKIITFADPSYPAVLKELSNPPICLYVKGSLPDLENEPIICIVGKRKCSEYGGKVAWSLSARLTLGGITVLSGGAMGADAFAHKGALDVEGKTIAILACGINNDYLKTNEKLREKIANSGCLISEYSPDEPVYRQNFRVRNRLLSALSLGTVVIEAGKGSGATITANCALEQGKDVFVITGKPNDPNYYGNNQLLRDGAKPVFEANDIFGEYYSRFPDKIDEKRASEVNLSKIFNEKYCPKPEKANHISKLVNEPKEKKKEEVQKNNILPLSKNAKIVYNCINSDFFTLDDLLSSGLSFEDVLTAVTELELNGLVNAVPGGRYSVIR